MNKAVPDSSWLPPRDEWDFRAVTPAECRVACHWEYSRDIRRVTDAALRSPQKLSGTKPPAGRTPLPYFPPNYRQPAAALFPRPWLSLTKDQRAAILDTFYPVPAVQIRKLGDFLRRWQGVKGPPQDGLRSWLESYSYVLQPNFTLCGVEAVLREFEAWARDEAKHYPPAPHAKAAELPFDALKWLAVSRLEDARRNARLSFDQARLALMAYRRKNPLKDRSDAFPIYASHGAWSKARADAARCRTALLRQPAFFLAGLS